MGDSGRALDLRRNGLNALRLVLAATVIVGHSWPLGGFGDVPAVGGMNVGTWAVCGFFAVSGYLVTASRERRTVERFAAARFLRIYPGLWASLLVTAFVAAPIAWQHQHGSLAGYGSAQPWRYVTDNASAEFTSYTIPGTLDAVPFPGVWGGPLWSIHFEVICYVLVAVIPLTARRAGVALGVCALLATFLVASGMSPGAAAATWLQVGPCFLAGALLYLARDRVPFTAPLAAAAAGLLAVLAVVGLAPQLGALPLAYLCLYAGAVLPLTSVGRRRDLSYGLYIYGWTVQQLLAEYGLQRHGLAAFVALSLACTVPLAFLSWTLVERPCQRLGRDRQVPHLEVAELAAGRVGA